MLELGSFFNPKTLAVIGASNKEGKIGHAIINAVADSGYAGGIFPVNPGEESIRGFRCYKGIEDIKQEIDLAVVAVPASGTLSVVEQCGVTGVKNLVVVTAGFKEVGKEGLEREKKLVDLCRQYKMNMLGPNCVGMMDTHIPLNASFSSIFPRRGEIAFISQSGAMLVAILDWSRANGLGFSKVISLGNKALLTETHFIEAAARDPNTRVILCYIEDVADGELFLEVAGRASREKPLIILKSGTSQAGAQAASSHTGALAGSDLAYDTAFRQAGIIRAKNMAELFDLAVSFANQPVPRGDKIAVVTNAGGPGIVTTDSIESNGLKMARFSKETIDRLRTSLPAESNIYNPVDVLGDAGADRYRFSLDRVLADEGVDSAVVLVCPTAVTDAENTSRAIIDLHKNHPDKPVFAAYMGGESLSEGARMLARARIPTFTFPETAISSMAGMFEYTKVRNRHGLENENIPLDNINRELVREIFDEVKGDNRLVLLGSESARVMEAYGIPAAPIRLATSPEEAVKLGEEMGYPLVMKVASPKILHKTDVGGVKIGLNDARQVRNAFIEIVENIQRYLPHVVIYGVEVQKMMPKGMEIIVGMTRDVQFGPLIAFGLGGIYVNLIKDVSFRLARGLTIQEINNMIAETKANTLLRGYRGEKPADLNAIIDIVAKTSRLAMDFKEITEMDINPVFAYNQGASALDIKITVS